MSATWTLVIPMQHPFPQTHYSHESDERDSSFAATCATFCQISHGVAMNGESRATDTSDKPEDVRTAEKEAGSLVGTLLGERYLVRRFLASGGMGMVYEGHHVVLHTDIAIKIVPLGERALAEARFLREARLACTVRHPNLVQIMDCGILPNGRGYLIMELLHGKTLAASLSDGAMDPLRVCLIGAQVARGLLAIHERGIVHCDMKPRNILLVAQDDGADFVKIIDFGIAKQVAGSEADTRTPQDVDIPSLFPHRHSQRLKRHTQSTMGTLAGTPLYMSPEQCQGLPLDGRSDMYSFGCVLFEMLTGSAPFQRSTLVEILDAHLTAPVPPLHPPKGDLTHSFEQLVLRMLAKDPMLRLPSMQQVERQLRQEADLLRIQRGEQVMWEREHLQWLVQRHARARQPSLANSSLLRQMLAILIALISIRFGRHLRPILPPAPPLPHPPHIEALRVSKPGAAHSTQRAHREQTAVKPQVSGETFRHPADTDQASASPAAANAPLPAQPAQ